MSSPYGWGITPKQPSQAGELKPTPAQGQPSRAAGYSQKQESQPSRALGYFQPQQSQQAPTYGFNLPSQRERQSTPQYGFGSQQEEEKRAQENQPVQQYDFGAQQQEQPAPQYGFGAQQQEQSSPQYGFAPQQQYQQPASQPTEPYGQVSQQYAGAPTQQYQFDNNDKYNTKAILGLIFTFLFWPVGLVLSIMGRNEIKQNGGKGKGLTTASFVLCGLSILISIIAWVFLIGVLNSGAGRTATHEGRSGGYSYSQRVTPDETPSASEGIKPSASNNPAVSSKDGKYITVAEWFNNSDEAKQFVQKAKDMYGSSNEEDRVSVLAGALTLSQ